MTSVVSSGADDRVRSAPLRRLRHPQEESPLWGLACSIVGAVFAVALSLPLLALLALLLPPSLLARAAMLRAWRWRTSHRGPPDAETGAEPCYEVSGDPEAVRGNDERWLGEAWNRSVSHAVLVFDAGLDERHLQELLLARVVPRYPRLACRLARLTPASSHHVWLPASPLHIERHVFRARAQEQQGCTEGELQRYVENLLAQALPTDKPLWEVHVLPRYGRHGDTAAVLRVHQSVADGMALVRVLCHALADSRVLHVPQKPHFGGLTFSLNAIRALLVGPAMLFTWLILAIRAPRRSILSTCPSTSSQVQASTTPVSSTPTIPEEQPGYSVAWSAAIALHKVARIKHVTRSTVNEVLLAALAGAVRTLLQGCGVRHPPNLKILMPVDLRADALCPEAHPHLGCKMAPVVVGLPASVEGAIPRLWATRRVMAELRSSAAPAVTYLGAAALMTVLPARWARRALQVFSRPTSLQFASLPGPSATVLVGGHPLKCVYPLLPAPEAGPGLAVSVFTYADQVYVTVLAEKSQHPSARKLLALVHHQVDALWTLLMHRRAPGEGRPLSMLLHVCDISSPMEEEAFCMQLQARLHEVQGEVTTVSQRLHVHQHKVHKHEEEEAEDELTDKLDELKAEFTQLLGEVRRRRSLLGDPGASPIFEDEEVGGELWRPRRRSVRSLAGLLGVPSRPVSSATPDDSPASTPPAEPADNRPL